MSVPPSFRLSTWNNSAPDGRILIEFGILSIFRKSVEKMKSSIKIRQKRRILYVKT